ncbi:SRPBCC family protein [soil metagenome]
MSRATPLSVTVTKVIDADPQTIYQLISDIEQMGTYSPETVSAEWLDGADGPVEGARFKGTNAIGSMRWSTKPVVTVADPGGEFAFRVPGRADTRWSYVLEPLEALDSTGASKLVTESVQQAKPSPFPIRLLQRRAGVTDRADHLRAGMATTLDRLAETAQAMPARPTAPQREHSPR